MAGRSSLSSRLKVLKDYVEKNQQADAEIAVPGGEKKQSEQMKALDLGSEWHQISDFCFTRSTSYPDPLADVRWPSQFLQSGYRPDDLRFMDTETTGLSGGAGTVAFLFGVGCSDSDGGFTVTQVFLSDYPGEPEYLDAIAELIDPDKELLSYNGASFDLPLLTTRFRMNGVRFPAIRHTDLLYPTRRLWKTLLESCTLGTIEQCVLDIHRDLDIPGAEVPERYFSFLKTGDPLPLKAVFAHHAQDIVSLACLFARLEMILRSPYDCEVDGYGLGKTMDELGIHGWDRVLSAAFDGGNHAAGRYLTRRWKQLGRWTSAAPIWRRMIEGEYGGWAGVELAKYLEHRVKDLSAAAILVSDLMAQSGGSESFLIDLHRRSERLAAKIAAASSD